MNSKALKTVVGVVVGLVSAYLTYQFIDRLNRESGVSTGIVESSWVRQDLGSSGICFDVPWPLENKNLPLPQEIAAMVESSVFLGREADGIQVMALHLAYRPGTELSLEGAADGSLANLRNTPGTASVEGGKTPSKVLDLEAFDVNAKIGRNRGEPLQLYSVVFRQGRELFQLQFLCLAGQEAGKAGWDKLRASIRRKQG